MQKYNHQLKKVMHHKAHLRLLPFASTNLDKFSHNEAPLTTINLNNVVQYIDFSKSISKGIRTDRITNKADMRAIRTNRSLNMH